MWSRFVLRGLPYTKNISQRKQIERQGHIKQLEEAAWTNFCDVTTAVSHVDAEYYRNLTQDPGKIHLFSNVIDINNYLIKSPAPDGFLKPCIYLAGTFGSEESPMGHAAKWLIEEVLSLIKISIPNIRLYLVGNGSDEHFGDLNRADVIALGKVDSVLPYLCNADAALVPLFFESGTRFKIIEAAACGVPIVSTTLGAEGIPVQHGRDILIADTPQDFADAIIKLIVDKQFAAVLAKNCRELVIASNSVDALVEEAKCIINYLENFD